MGRTIVKIEDYYLEWSSVVDAPIAFGMKFDDFEKYHLEEYGRHGHQDFAGRMRRVKENGTSNLHGRLTPEEIIRGNRAGPEEAELTYDEVYQAYCLRMPIRDGWIVPAESEEDHGNS